MPRARAVIPIASSPTSSTATSTTPTSAWRAATSARSTGTVGSADGYVLGFDEIFSKIDETISVGGGQLLLQGGHNPDLPIGWYEDLFRAVKARYPDFKLHALSPPEVLHISRMAQLHGARRHRAAHRRRPRQHSRRRRRDPRRSRAQAAALLRQGDRRRVAGRDARGASGRPSHDRDDDVRHGRDARGTPRAPVAAARPAGRDRRLHGVHHVELPARSHRAWARARHHARGDRRGLPAHAGGRAAGPRQLRQPPVVVGHAGRQGGAVEPALRRQRHGLGDDRGKRRPRGRRGLLHGRGRDRPQHRGRRLQRQAPQHALRRAGRSHLPRARRPAHAQPGQGARRGRHHGARRTGQLRRAVSGGQAGTRPGPD